MVPGARLRSSTECLEIEASLHYGSTCPNEASYRLESLIKGRDGSTPIMACDVGQGYL